MRKFLIVIISVLLTVLEVSIMPYFKIGLVALRFSLVTVILVAWFSKNRFGIINAAVVGAVFDVFAAKTYFVYLILYVLIAVLVEFVAEKADENKVYICLVSTFCISTIIEFMVFFMSFFKYRSDYTAYALSRIVLPQAFLNVIVCFVLFYIFRRLVSSKK